MPHLKNNNKEKAQPLASIFCSNNLQKELTGFGNKQGRECKFIIRKMAVCRPSFTFQ
jgi:hypothetical protein